MQWAGTPLWESKGTIYKAKNVCPDNCNVFSNSCYLSIAEYHKSYSRVFEFQPSCDPDMKEVLVVMKGECWVVLHSDVAGELQLYHVQLL